ncbi:beta-Amyrin Synthase 2 [Artemisia annua]|uniref:Beta-Amyrin Synthase 2 n=1 Tax=Artemisia annua TaxID=35608 RepID=A0A2U1KXG9_ARTAN|nr:beta-Amyrin Synthase 2 [Artemisia annua]
MFCTTLSYICMRLLGEGPHGGLNGKCTKARKWILDHGSVTSIPSWGETWLSINVLKVILPKMCQLDYGELRCVVLRPGFIYGKRKVGEYEIPLHLIVEPIERLLSCSRVFNTYGFAVILLKVLVKAATFPLSIKQVESAMAMRSL